MTQSKSNEILWNKKLHHKLLDLGGSSDFSLLSLFLRADFVVKSVIIILIAASVYSWALIFDKYRLFKKINISIIDFENKFWKAKSAESFDNNLPAKSNDPAILIFKSAMNELRKTRSKSSAVQLARVERVLEINTDNQIKIIEKNFTFLATVGATAPFIGLFGTVWGIMNSFQSIAISRNTSLAIVAPGIAEALFATALGLLAAIPAVIAYNKFNSDTKNYVARLDNFSKKISFNNLITMAFNFKRSKNQPMSEINVTPFVDVMLVLLIIFMVTAPLLTVGVQVDLPESAADSLPDDQEPLTLSINSKGEVFIQEHKVNYNKIIPKLLAIAKNRTDTRIYVRGDKNINYGRVLEVMGTLSGAGFSKVALISEPYKN